MAAALRVLVTGGGGFAGAHIARALAERGFAVTALYRHTPGMAAALAGRVALAAGDLATLSALPGPPDAVVHAASTLLAGGSTAAVVRDNVIGTRNLLALALAAGCSRFIFCSTMGVYGRVSVAQVDETTPIVDPDGYGESKLIGEQLLEAQHERLAGLTLRLPALLGRGAHDNWPADAAAALRRGEPARIYNPDAAFNNAVHVADLAAFIAAALQRGWTGYDRLVLGAAGSMSIRGFAQQLARRMGIAARIETVVRPRRAFTISSARAIRDWGYRPSAIEAILERYAAEAAA